MSQRACLSWTVLKGVHAQVTRQGVEVCIDRKSFREGKLSRARCGGNTQNKKSGWTAEIPNEGRQKTRNVVGSVATRPR